MDEPREVDEWVMICVLGAGAFGKVTLWRNKNSDEHVAVKKCKFNLPGQLTKRQKERWIYEVEIIKSMDNENIIRYQQLPPILEKALGQYNPTHLPLLPMEYCSKGNLRRFLTQPKNLKGCSDTDVRCILRDVANAVSYLHSKNITHRDIKPENIVIQECDKRPTKNLYKLIDLGYAKELETIASFVGTLPYLAPEIFHTQTYNNSVDYWSMGILTYEIITGEHPFLPTKTPVERFNYLKEKSNDHICISVSADGNVKFSNEIVLENHLSKILKKDIEDWLKLLLVYDSNKRGLRNGERKNIFIELEYILDKTMLKVFSVFNYRIFDYRIEEDTKLSDIKVLLERDADIPSALQMFVKDNETMLANEDVRINDIYECNSQKVLYLFKKNHGFEQRTVVLPQQVKELFQQTNDVARLQKIFPHTIFFINREKDLLEIFIEAVICQAKYVAYYFNKQIVLYNTVRNDLLKMLTQIECFHDLSRCQCGHINTENEEYVRCLIEGRIYLRQAKELVENFNSLTKRFLDTLKVAWVCNHTESLKVALDSSKTAMTRMYNSAITAHQKINTSESPVREMINILNTAIKIPMQGIFQNPSLNNYLRHTLLAQRKLQKLSIWTDALGNEIKNVSSLICNYEKSKFACTQNAQAPAFRISVPNNLDVIEINQLISDNQDLRYRIQEVSSEGSAYLRNVQKEILYFWNGIIFPTSQR